MPITTISPWSRSIVDLGFEESETCFNPHLRFGRRSNPRLRGWRDELVDAVWGGRRRQHITMRTATVEAVICNLLVSNYRYVHGRDFALKIPLRKSSWTDRDLSYDHVRPMLTYLSSRSIIYMRSGFHDHTSGEGEMSRIVPRQQFADLLADMVVEISEAEHVAEVRGQVVVLKDADGRVVDYRQNRATRALAKDIRRINRVNSGADITYTRSDYQAQATIDPGLYAVFNVDWQHGGRLYTGHLGHQALEREERPSIRVDGHPTAELDFKALHVTLLYAMVGQVFAEDPYLEVRPNATKEFRNAILKPSLLALLNDTADEAAAIRHIEWNLLNSWRTAAARVPARYPSERNTTREECERNRQLLEDHGVTVGDIVRRFKEAHSPIGQYFHSGIGLRLQNIDGKIARKVLVHFAAKGVVSLPVHDSFVIRLEHTDELREVMKAAYGDVTGNEFGFRGEITVK